MRFAQAVVAFAIGHCTSNTRKVRKAEGIYETAANSVMIATAVILERKQQRYYQHSTDAMGESGVFTAVHQTAKPRCTPVGRETIPFALLMILLLLTWI